VTSAPREMATRNQTAVKRSVQRLECNIPPTTEMEKVSQVPAAMEAGRQPLQPPPPHWSIVTDRTSQPASRDYRTVEYRLQDNIISIN